MHAITRQLVRIRRLGRGLLVTQRLAQALAAAVAIVAALALIDYLLRLPGALRGGVMAAVLIALGLWLGTRLVRAIRFAPTLTDLALRAERLFPQFAGSLASAVEFTERPEAYADPSRTAVFADASRSRAGSGLEPGQLRTLLAPRRTVIAVALAGGLAALAGVTIAAAPEASRIAAARWFTPWAEVDWPKRTAVVALTDAAAWPADTPLPLRSAIERGHYPNMRVWVNYRLVGEDGEPGRWQRVLMSEQTAPAPAAATAGMSAGEPAAEAQDDAQDDAQHNAADLPRFERLVELADTAPPADEHGQRGRIEYYFEAGDDQTAPQELTLIERPAVTAVQARIAPPAYARGLVEPRATDLHARSERTPTTRGLVGSTAELRVRFNKPLPIAGDQLAAVFPGLPAEPVQFAAENETPHEIALRFPLSERIETPIVLEDAHGFANRSERRYVLDALRDEPPTASLLRPERDLSVLPEAEVDLEALVQDEVGAERIAIVAEMPAAALEGSGSASEETTSSVTLADRTGRQRRLSVTHALDLAEFSLSAGDTVTLVAVGRDVYEINGQRHDPVRSAPRRLRIIDEATLTRQLRSELAGVRQQAVRLDARQRQLLEQPPDQARPRQRRLTQQIESQQSLLERLMDRAERNRLDEPALDELMEQAQAFLEDAGDASAQADGALADAAEAIEQDADDAEARETAAREHQEDVRAALNDLVSLLDQGQDAMALQLDLRRLHTEQRDIEAETGELLPQTAGSALEDLPEALREQLREMAQRQQAAAEQAQELLGEMQSTAEALAQADDERSEAAAEALAEAAHLAEREGLAEQMDDSSEAIDQNRLSQAGQTQAQSLDVMQRMLEEMSEHEQRMQAMLVRRLEELADRLERLLERQQAQLARLDEDDVELAALTEGQIELREATMAAADLARRDEQTAPVAETIELAIDAQAAAVGGLRDEDARAAGAGKQEAVDQLEAALEQVRQQREQVQQEQLDEQRRELQQAYEQLAERQDALHQRVLEVLDPDADEPVNRRQRAALMGVGGDQEELRADAAELGERIEQSLLFDFLHERVDETAGRAAGLLRQAEVSEVVPRAQQRVATDLRRMAAALDPDGEESDFAGPQANGGGGGGDGEAGEQIVPPLAELVLLRALQEATLEETRDLDDRRVDDLDDTQRDRLGELSTEQSALADLGEQLIEQMQQQMQTPDPAQREPR